MAKPGDKGQNFIGPVRPPSVADAPSSVADVKKKAKLDKIAGAGTLKEVAEGIEKLTTAQEATTAAVEQVSENFPKADTKEEEKEKKKGFKDMLDGIKKAIGGVSTKKAIGGIFGKVFGVIKKVFALISFKFIGIGLLIGAFIATLPMKKLKAMWDSFKDVMLSLWDIMQPILKYLWDWLNKKVFPNLVEWFIDTFKSITEMFKKIKERFSGWSEKSLWEKIKAVFGVFYDIGEALVKIVANAIVKIAAMFGMDGEFWTDTWNSIKAIPENVMKWLRETFTKENIIGAIKTGWAKIANIGQWLWDNAIKPIVNWLERTFDIDLMGPIKEGWAKIANLGTWFYDNAIKPFVSWLTGLFDSDEKTPEGAGKSFWEKMFPKGIGTWFVETLFDPLVGFFKDTFKFGSFKEIMATGLSLLWMPWELLKKFLINPLVTWLGKKFEFDSSKFTDFSLGQLFTKAMEGIVEWFGKIFDIDIKAMFGSILGKAGAIGKKIWGWMKGDKKEEKEVEEMAKEPLIPTGTFDEIRKMFQGLLESFASLIRSMRDSLTPLAPGRPGVPSKPPSGSELAQIKADEGFEAGVYEDTMGIKTIGYGFNLERAGSKEALEKAGIEKSVADLASGKAKLTEEEASQLMLGEMGHFKLVAKRFVGEDVWKNLSGNRQGIITNMAYNMGEGTLKQFKKLRAAIRGGDWQEAQVQMADSDWSKQVKGRSDRLIARMGQNDTGIQLASAGAPGGAGSGGRSNVIIAPSTVNQNNNNTPLYIEENSFANNQAIDFHRA